MNQALFDIQIILQNGLDIIRRQEAGEIPTPISRNTVIGKNIEAELESYKRGLGIE